MHTVLRVAALAVACVVGWLVGTFYPAPPQLVAAVNPTLLEDRAIAGVRSLSAADLHRMMTAEQTQAMELAHHAAGAVVTIERDLNFSRGSDAPDDYVPPAPSGTASLAPPSPSLAAQPPVGPMRSATAPAPAGPPMAGMAMSTPAADIKPAPLKAATFISASSSFGKGLLSDPTEASLSLCPRMQIHNAPSADGAGRVKGFSQFIRINTVRIALDPAPGACLSSGFGQRGARPHDGIDYYSPEGGQIHAAADGTVIEMKYRDDFGNMVLIDHGGGVYTRYAHLASFQSGLGVGAKVHAGNPIGLMGNTAGYPVPVHLHYEVLLGNYANPKASFGLDPKDPFGYLDAG